MSYHFSLWGPNPFSCQEIPQLEDSVREKLNVNRGDFAFHLLRVIHTV